MPTGANLPSVDQVLDIAGDFGLELTLDEARSYCNLLRGALKTYPAVSMQCPNTVRR